MKFSNTPSSEQFFQYVLCHNMTNTGSVIVPERPYTIRFKTKNTSDTLADFGFKINVSDGVTSISRSGVERKFKTIVKVKPDIALMKKDNSPLGFIEVKSLVSTLVNGTTHELRDQILLYVLAHMIEHKEVPKTVILAYITDRATHFASLEKAKKMLISKTGASPRSSIERVKFFISEELDNAVKILKGLGIILIGSLICAEKSGDITLNELKNNIFYSAN